ncbi:MAG TPA: substrate-binding domain-containing protein, partial [Flavisolibacter sp.]
MTHLFTIALAVLTHTTAMAQDTLFVYGPGGPQAPMEECARIFARKHSIPVVVTAGPEARWIVDAQKKADVVFGGAEYMLTQFSMQHPGLIDSTTRRSLYKRAAGILVRPGNPKKITGLADLARPGIRLLDVNGAGQLGMWEDLAGRKNLIAPIRKNIIRSFVNTAQAIEAWKLDSTYDAWIIYASWHYRLKDITSLV